ncbi:MAG: DNA polymerase I, partial [Treponema sp.]|nr:DNA polymerase I [Treponema sp.]
MTKLPPLYLIDAYGLIYRSYFAFLSHPLRNNMGRNISALFGFARTLVGLIDEGAGADSLERPRRLAVAFDSRTPTFRHKMYPEYKATRQKAPEDLHDQVPLVEETLAALGVPSLRLDGYEADDIIATLAMKCQAEKRQCYILSSDKDLLQLVGEGTFELRPVKNAKTLGAGSGGTGSSGGTGGNGRTEDSAGGIIGGHAWELVGPPEVKVEWGVSPDKVLDLLSLTGDSSDNVPGVKGVGEKTAVKLMTRYGSLDGIYKNIAGIEGAVGKKLAEGKESAYFSKSLIKLDCAVPLSIKNIDELSIENLNRPAGAKVLLREGIRQSALALDPSLKSAGGTVETAGGGKGSGAGETSGDTAAPGGLSGMEVPDPALLGTGSYRPLLDMPELEALLKTARKQGLLALDFETDSLDAWNARPIGLSLALRPKEAFYVPVAPHQSWEGEGPVPFLDGEKVRALLEPLLLDPGMTIAAHNAKYDYKVSRGWGVPRWKCRIWDTMVAAWVDDPERNNYSLDSLAIYHFGHTPIAYNDIVPRGKTFEVVPLETAVSYSGEDADFTLRLKQFLEARLAASESLKLFTGLEMPLLPILAEMEGVGIKIEPRSLREYGREMFQELKEIQAETWKIVGHEFNLGSTKQLQEVLFTERKLKPGKKTKTGYSTDVDVLM